MKLVCPHCAKVIDVPESAAGQTTTCPLCQGPLTVPFGGSVTPPASVPPAGPPTNPAPLPPPPPPPAPPDPLAHTTAWPQSRSGTVVPPVPHQPKAGHAAGTAILGRLQQLKLPSGFHEWLGVSVLAILFVLFFFPWLGIYLGDVTLVQQSGAGAAFGSASATPEGLNLSKTLTGSSLLMLAFLVSLVGLLLLVVILVEKFVHAQAVQNFKPTLQRIAALREHIVAVCLLIITLIFLLYYLFASFPLEQAARSDKAGDTLLMGLKLKVDGIESVKSAEMLAMQLLQRRCWFGFATLLALVSTLWVGYRWLSDRGYTRRWPRIVIQWPASDSPALTFDAPTPASDLSKSDSNSTA